MKRILAAMALVLLVQVSAIAQDEKTEEKEKKYWSYSAFFELVGRTGTVEKKRHAGGLTAIRQGTKNRLKLYTGYVFSSDSGVKTEEEYIAGVDDEHLLSERTAWYGRTEWESDDIEEVRYRLTVATGIGYYFLKEDDHKMRGRIGAFYRDEDYKTFKDNRTFGLELGLYDQMKLSDWGTWTTELVYTPSLEEQRDYRITYESKLELPFKTIEAFTMEMGVYGQYNNYTPGPLEHYDTNYFIRLKFVW